MGLLFDRRWRFEDRFGAEWVITLAAPSDADRATAIGLMDALARADGLIYGTFIHSGARHDTRASVLLAVYDALTNRRLSRELPRPTNDPRRVLRNFDAELRMTLVNALMGGSLRVQRAPRRVWPFPDAPSDPVPAHLDVPVAEQTTFIGLVLVDQTGRPVANRAYRVVFPDGSSQDGTLDGKGAAMLSGTVPGTCQVYCPYVEAHPELTYAVQQGDHLSGVAETSGFDDYTLVWNAPGNADLKSQRSDPHLLLPGDSLTIPELTARPQSKPTGATHTFTIIRSPLKLRLKLLDLAANPALAGSSVTVGDAALTTDGTGMVEATLDKTDRTVPVQLEDSRLALNVGTLNPSDDTSDAGYKARLFNLGFLWDPTVDDSDEEMVIAVQDFQAQYELPVTGQLDDATAAQIAQTYGC